MQIVSVFGRTGLQIPAQPRGGDQETHVPMQGATPCRLSMCGRFTLEPTTKFFERFKIDNRLDGLTARYHIVPTQDVPVIVRNSPNRIVMLRWGLIPHWAKADDYSTKDIFGFNKQFADAGYHRLEPSDRAFQD